MKRGIQRVMGVVPTRLPMPSLGNIFVSLKNKMLEITATDLEITVTAKVEILDSEGEGSVLIQAKRGSAKIGIIAPDDYDILRDELTEEYESVN